MYGAGLGEKAMEENTETTLRFMDRSVGTSIGIRFYIPFSPSGTTLKEVCDSLPVSPPLENQLYT